MALSFISNNYNYYRRINFLRDSGFIHRFVDGGYYNLYIGNTTKVKKSNFLIDIIIKTILSVQEQILDKIEKDNQHFGVYFYILR